MKKFLALLAVVAMVCLSSLAFAADVTVGGSIDIRSRDFSTLSLDKDATDPNSQPDARKRDSVDTQERIRLNINVKSDNVKAKVSIENDWDTWGRFENPQGNGATAPAWTVSVPTSTAGDKSKGRLDVREAWISFDLPGIPVNVTGGHQLLQLGNGWFFRSMKYGSDAWVVANVTGPNTAAIVDVKISEGQSSFNHDDVDAYVLLDVFKINENMTAGIDITFANDRANALGFNTAGFDTKAQNISLNFNGKLGAVVLKAQADVQTGKAKGAVDDAKFKGNEIVVQGNVPVDPVTINFTVARGSGKKFDDTSPDIKQYVNFLDADQHYTFLYEYKVNGACGDVHQGFCNTTALSAGVMANVAKSVSVGADFWFLKATEKVLNGVGDNSDKVGTEIDAKINWKLYDALSWNWQIGWFKPGDALKTPAGTTDAATGIQGVLSYQF